MVLGATMYVFEIELADSDRGVYESFEVRAARHPSEAPDYLITRVLAYCLEYTEGISFSNGLSTPDEPTIAVRDLTGAMQAWIDIGAPSPSGCIGPAKPRRGWPYIRTRMSPNSWRACAASEFTGSRRWRCMRLIPLCSGAWKTGSSDEWHSHSL